MLWCDVCSQVLPKKSVNHLLSHPRQWQMLMEIYCLSHPMQLKLIVSLCIVHKVMFHQFAPWVYRMQTHQCMPWMTKKSKWNITLFGIGWFDSSSAGFGWILTIVPRTISCNACRHLGSMLYDSSQLSYTFLRPIVLLAMLFDMLWCSRILV